MAIWANRKNRGGREEYALFLETVQENKVQKWKVRTFTTHNGHVVSYGEETVSIPAFLKRMEKANPLEIVLLKKALQGAGLLELLQKRLQEQP